MREREQRRQERESDRNAMGCAACRLRAEGLELYDIADRLGMSYSWVQRTVADIGGPTARQARPWRRFTDDELRAAVCESQARTVYAYDQWRRAHPEAPSAGTILGRLGSWKAAIRSSVPAMRSANIQTA